MRPFVKDETELNVWEKNIPFIILNREKGEGHDGLRYVCKTENHVVTFYISALYIYVIMDLDPKTYFDNEEHLGNEITRVAKHFVGSIVPDYEKTVHVTLVNMRSYRAMVVMTVNNRELPSTFNNFYSIIGMVDDDAEQLKMVEDHISDQFNDVKPGDSITIYATNDLEEFIPSDTTPLIEFATCVIDGVKTIGNVGNDIQIGMFNRKTCRLSILNKETKQPLTLKSFITKPVLLEHTLTVIRFIQDNDENSLDMVGYCEHGNGMFYATYDFVTKVPFELMLVSE